MEILAEIDLRGTKNLGLAIKGGALDAASIAVNLDGTDLKVMDAKGPLEFSKGEPKLKLHIFIDHSVLEVFANETLCFTKVISSLDYEAKLRISAKNGAATAKEIRVWPLKTIW